MVATCKYSDEKMQEAVSLAKELKSIRNAAKQLGIPEKSVSRWVNCGTPLNRSIPKSDLLQELSDLIIRNGPEIASHQYERLCKNPGTFRKYWPSWVEFRNEAAKLCPFAPEYNRRIFLEVKNALFLGGSDFHYWPYWGEPTAHRALVYFAKKLGPTHLMLNGDIPDFPQITHHRPIAWKKIPDLRDELNEVLLRVGEIEQAAAGAEKYWNYGNHCIRFDNRLAEKVPEYQDITGTRLSHHFPRWKFQNTIRINDTELEIKHRYRGGELAVRNNVIRAGISIWTGHDHNREVWRHKDLRGTRYGMNPGMAADPWGPQFEYNENHPSNHDSGLLVVQFRNYKMMPPELIETIEPGVVWFRGERHQV